MIEPASLIGFGLTFLAAAWVSSAALCTTILLARHWLRRLGPAAERAAAGAALALGPLLGVALVLALAGHSLAAGATDHCPEHGHHPHLCLLHGGGWAQQSWAVALLAMIGTYLAVRLLQQVVGAAQSARALRRLARLARLDDDGVLVAPATSWFCFVAGWRRPRIFVSSAAWETLEPSQRRAVVAHERAHVSAGDLGRRAQLGLAALLGAPLLARRTLALWHGAAERHCDEQAARVVDPTVVAETLVAMTRARPPAPAGLAFAPAADVTDRVEALLAGHSSSETAPTRLRRGAWLLLLMAAGSAIAFADPLHHLIETLLGAI